MGRYSMWDSACAGQVLNSVPRRHFCHGVWLLCPQPSPMPSRLLFPAVPRQKRLPQPLPPPSATSVPASRRASSIASRPLSLPLPLLPLLPRTCVHVVQWSGDGEIVLLLVRAGGARRAAAAMRAEAATAQPRGLGRLARRDGHSGSPQRGPRRHNRVLERDAAARSGAEDPRGGQAATPRTASARDG